MSHKSDGFLFGDDAVLVRSQALLSDPPMRVHSLGCSFWYWYRRNIECGLLYDLCPYLIPIPLIITINLNVTCDKGNSSSSSSIVKSLERTLKLFKDMSKTHELITIASWFPLGVVARSPALYFGTY